MNQFRRFQDFHGDLHLLPKSGSQCSQNVFELL
jgi:hypothetical protein